MRIDLRTVLITLMFVTTSCVVTAGSHRSEQASTAFTVLTAHDLEPLSARNLYEAISELRPAFVRPNLRGEPPTLFVNGIAASTFDVLRYMSTSDVAEVRLLRGPDATIRYGSVHNGAILDVTLRSR